MLTEKQMGEIRKELSECERPLIFYDSDADGLCSFLQFYHQVQSGKGVMVKSTPKLDERFYATVDNYGPDKIFALDLAIVTQEFVDRINVPLIWLDHHGLSETKGARYYNPKQNKKNDNTCISKLSYDIFKEHFWIAAVGTVGDWQLPTDLRKQLIKEYPDLFDKKVKTPEEALFGTKIGELAKIFNFILKGNTKEAQAAVKTMLRIKDPKEILEQTTPQGKFIMKKVAPVYDAYNSLLKDAKALAKKAGKMIVFTYDDNKMSLSGELSNELLYLYPKKAIIVARRHNGEMKTSFRSGKNLIIREVLEKAIVGIDGRFGGHDHACGGCIKEDNWNDFLRNIEEEL